MNGYSMALANGARACRGEKPLETGDPKLVKELTALSGGYDKALEEGARQCRVKKITPMNERAIN